MNQYLIAIDMDGTLLKSDKTISAYTIETIKDLQRQGHIIVIASGRPFRAIKKYYEMLDLNTPVICYNGAYIHFQDPKFPSYALSFPRHIIKEIIKDIGRDKIVNVMCETNHEIWLIQEDEFLNDFFIHDGMNVIYGEIEETLNQDPMTMIIQTVDLKYNDIIQKAIESHQGLKCRFWSGEWNCFSEIYFESTNKANALQKITAYYKIPRQQVITIGDASNDLEMLEHFGIGIAMKNAEDDIKLKADVVSEFTNDEDGVAFALKKILNGCSVI